MRTYDVEKTAFVLPFGHFEFLILLFGLCNVPHTFQKAIGSLLQNHKNVFVFLDDILIASSTEAEHFIGLNAVFETLHKKNLSINFRKSKFKSNSVKYLGAIIDKGVFHQT